MFVAIVAYLTYHRDFYLRAFAPSSTYSKEVALKKLIQKMVEQEVFVHDQICSEIANACFRMVDKFWKEKNGRIRMARIMQIMDTDDFAYSLAYLDFPKELNDDTTSSTRHWPIDKRRLTSFYSRVMVGMAFAMEALQTKSDSWQDTLMIGLGGGVIANFLTAYPEAKINLTTVELDPVMPPVARDWFGLVENESNRVVVQDGAAFIDENAKNGIKYKAVFVDACFEFCPAGPFMEPGVAKIVAAIVEENGVAVVNVIGDRKKQDQLEAIYGKHFASCFYFYLKHQQLLMCSHREKWTLVEQRQRFESNLKQVDEYLHLGVMLPSA